MRIIQALVLLGLSSLGPHYAQLVRALVYQAIVE